jgi:hypothetical protein
MLKCEKHSFDIRGNEHKVTDKIATPPSSVESKTAGDIRSISVSYPVNEPM